MTLKEFIESSERDALRQREKRFKEIESSLEKLGIAFKNKKNEIRDLFEILFEMSQKYERGK